MHHGWIIVCAVVLVFRATPSSSSGGTETLVGIVGKDFVMLGADSSISQSISLTVSNHDKIAVIVDPQLIDENEGSGNVVAIPSIHPRQQAILAAASGDTADTDRLVGFLRAHAAIREYEAGIGCDVKYVDLGSDPNNYNGEPSFAPSEPGLDVEAIAHLARGQIARTLRSPARLNVHLLIAGLSYSDDNNKSYDLHDFVSRQVQWQIQQQPFAPQAPSDATTTTEETTAIQHSNDHSILQPRLFWLDPYGALQELQYGAHGLGSNFLLSILDNRYRSNMNREQAAELLRECFAQLRQRYIVNSPEPPCIKCVDATGCRIISSPKLPP